MITNDRQYRISKAEAERFLAAYKAFDPRQDVRAGTHELIAKAKKDQLLSEYERLKEEIDEYDALRSGQIDTFETSGLRDLPLLLVKARIARGWTQKDLADALGIKEQQIQRYESDFYATARLATLLKVADALGLEVRELARLKQATDDLDGNFPIREMLRRGWFEHFSGGISEAKKRAKELIERFFLEAGISFDAVAMHRKNIRLRGKFDEYALLAWHARVITKSVRQFLPRKFAFDDLNDEWFRELSKLSAKSDGPQQARNWLIQSGIHFVVEPHLPQTHLDGAALLSSDGAPIVALTLRHDRLDNFWFVLFHELAHIKLHLSRPERLEFFDDTEVEADDLESEADRFALNSLIPPETWATSLAKFSKSTEAVIQEAKSLNIHPSVLAGRIRKERGNYYILNDLVGSGQVRRQFEETVWAA
jgi:HTH-type transcriptional regulator/antitoxin HigA